MTTQATSEDLTASGHERRRAAADERIVGAAAWILRRHGAEALTIERVALESGVAKTTIYRRDRFHGSGRLITEALTRVAEDVAGDWDGETLTGQDMASAARNAAREVVAAAVGEDLASDHLIDAVLRAALALDEQEQR